MIALKDKLVGSSRLVKYEELPVDGSPATPSGRGANAVITWQRVAA